MKANDLVHNGLYKVGDDVVYFYVLNGHLYKYDDKTLFGSVFTDIKTGELNVLTEMCGFEKITPIPLDKPILKANGFKGEDRLFTYYKCEDEDNPFMITKNKYGFYCIIANRLVYIEFVHELQSALHLCGLHELADYFKLNDND